MTTWAEITEAVTFALGGDKPEGRRRLLACWEDTAPDDHAHRCVLAHYLADTESALDAEIAWDEAALAAHAGVRDEDLAPLGIVSARGFAPSLHLNLGDGYLRRGEPEAARAQLELGLAGAGTLGADGYGAMIRAGLENLGTRIAGCPAGPGTGPLVSGDLFAPQATLTTDRLRLEPLGPQHFDGTWAGLQDPEARRLTGTHAVFTREQIHAWLASRADAADRADWAIIRSADNAYLGEVVLNELDPENASVDFRIALASAQVFGRGYGTEATRAVLAHAFDELGLHRVGLEVFAFNPRARRVYEKCGFTEEGRRRDALWWNGEWVDAVSMAILAGDPRP